jgi:hypothetical protein
VTLKVMADSVAVPQPTRSGAAIPPRAGRLHRRSWRGCPDAMIQHG